jgi:hypothetical protein
MIQYKWYLKSCYFVKHDLIHSRDLGAKLSQTDYDKACNEKAIFKKFLTDFVFTERNVMILPVGDPETSYRDEYTGFV